jgi:hypothetical protein
MLHRRTADFLCGYAAASLVEAAAEPQSDLAVAGKAQLFRK